MNILKSIKNLYKGEDKTAIHLSIFALTGITAVAFVNIVSLFIGNSIYSVFSTPKDEAVIIFSLASIMILFFCTGYNYKYSHKLFKDENSALPSVSMDCFVIFSKIFFLWFVWAIYFMALYITGGILFGTGVFNILFFGVAIPVLAPFSIIIYILFAQDFKYKKYLFNPLLILKIIKQTFIPVFLLFLQIFLLFFVILFCFKFLFKASLLLNDRFLYMVITLLLTSISGYLQEIINLAAIKEYTNIAQKHILKEP